MSIQSIAANPPLVDPSLSPRAAPAVPLPPAAEGIGAVRSPTAPSAAASESTQPAASARDALLHAVNELRAAIAPVEQNLLFSIDEDTECTVVKVVDATTDEVIRQIPSEEVLAITKALDKLQGVLIQQKA
ncbi:flagellar protein FlaG [Aromatoleum sp.]|uniref:flagellar protein FlaG n=1 Tax=Aromatoleum sp. TaxID=2307007 RepID=UPI002FC9D050